MSIPKVDSMIGSLQSLAASAGNRKLADVGGGEESVDFRAVLQKAVTAVNQAQNVAQNKVQAFSTGGQDMSLEEVMVSLQKANLAFQGMIAVRNKLVDAYRDVTNLQV